MVSMITLRVSIELGLVDIQNSGPQSLKRFTLYTATTYDVLSEFHNLAAVRTTTIPLR